MSRGLWLALLLACGSAASCMDEPFEGMSDESQEAHGTLSLNLTGVDTHGRTHRLRGADFAVQSQLGWSGYDGGTATSTVLSTESDPSAGILAVRLLPGWYTVSLRGDWYIERVGEDGRLERVQKVVLLSDPQQYAYIYDGSTSEVRFRFGVDGDLLDFRHGDLKVHIDIERPEDHAYGDAGVALDAGPSQWLDAGVYY